MSTATFRADLGTEGLQRFMALTWTLAITEFKLRFYGSVLGVAWTLIRPFAFFGVIYVVFVEIAKVGDTIPNYAEYLLLSLTLFGFFTEVAGGCVGALVVRGDLLRKIKVPYLIVPLSVMLTALMNLGMALIAVVVFLAAVGTYPSADWLQLIPILILLAVFALGIGLLLSALYVRFRDIAPIWDLFSQVLFYASPVLYVATMVPESFQRPYLANPLSALFTQMGHAVPHSLDNPVWVAIGGTERLLIPLAIIVGTFALGIWVFNREAPRVAERV